MTLRAQAEQALAATAPFSDGCERIDCHDGGKQLTCDLLALDRLACAIESLSVRSAALAGVSIDGLKKIAEQLARRLTYLLEPVTPVEADAEQCVVQLRSNPPQQDERGRSYYELLVNKEGRITLCRFSKQAGSPREIIPAQLTREVLLRLVGDLETCAA